ncbi:MAG: two-component regulator propeller domain-containing protein [bacterium]
MRQKPISAPLRYLAGPVFMCFLIITMAAPSAPAAADWISYVDPSLISGIVLHNGELYIASSGGLVVYDPESSSFEQFDNTVGLPSNFLTCLTFDAVGNLYVGTEDSGIARLKFTAGSLDVVPLSSTFHGLSDDRITSLAAWGDSVVYGTKKGAGLIIDGFPGARYLAREGLPSEVVTDVLSDGDRVWMATDSGLVYLDRFGFLTEVSQGLPDLNTKALARTDTAVWVGTGTGVAYLARGSEE